eukprot:CAMPEP_0196594916 /NCGR_PEP_ID=MMETSP1081-20130531/79650_1 /TAXON_ID=36882 /ORGANISM="Pyramimonas amylifera, Strain CCMP720" /LENGTH=233 /DNA_ID=CAMNT_0041919317 /DNA_START=272 /DNA_END=970 /DNA_ORIENTATION=-
MAVVEKRVNLRNSQGETLVGILETAEEGSIEESAGLCVLCHGFRNTKESGIILAIARGLHSGGLSTFRFDFSGNGESGGEFEFGNYGKETEDLRAVVEHLREFEGRKVGAVIGHSKAGNAVLLYGAKYGDVPVVVNVSGRFNMRRGIEERFGVKGMATLESEGWLEQHDFKGKYKITKNSIHERLALDMRVAKDNSGHVLTIHGTADEIIPIADAHEFASLGIKSHTLQVIED